MNWDVKHSCGHVETHAILATFSYVAETRARQLKRRKCSACYRAGRAAEAAVRAANDEATLAGIVLPALTGSERQVAWAETIRRERLAAAMRVDAEAARRFIDQAEAKWWIDHREQQLA